MSIAQQAFVCLLLTLCSAPGFGQDRTFLMPSGGGTAVTAFDAADLSKTGAIPATSTAFLLLARPQGDKYYIISRRGPDAIVIAESAGLEVLKRISLNFGATDAVLTPDGTRLLVTAGSLYIFNAFTDALAFDPIDVGSGPRKIRVDQRSRTAYILADGGDSIRVIDLESGASVATIQTQDLTSIGLVEAANFLTGLEGATLHLYDLLTNEEVGTIEGESAIRNGLLHEIPGSKTIFAQNRGSSPFDTSQLFDTETGNVKLIGPVSKYAFTRIEFLSKSRAFGIIQNDFALAEIDFTTTPNATVAPLLLPFSARGLSASPGGRFLYVSSLSDKLLAKFDTGALTVVHSVAVSSASSRSITAFAPSQLPPSEMEILVGDNQFLPPGAQTKLALTVRVTDENGVPLFNSPVSFTAPASDEIVFDAGQPVFTNAQGIAAVNVRVLTPEELALRPAPATLSGSKNAPAGMTPVSLAPSVVSLEEGDNLVDVVAVLATTTGGVAQQFSVNIIRGTGLNIFSGNHQVMAPLTDFAAPLLVLATDEMGNPLPEGTLILFSELRATCNESIVPVDRDGFAGIRCQSNQINPGLSLLEPGTVAATILTGDTLGQVVFDFTITLNAHNLDIEIVSGDNQSGRTSQPLPNPLIFRVTGPPNVVGQGLIGVELNQLQGSSPASISPQFVAVKPDEFAAVSMILGPGAGPLVIRARPLTTKELAADFSIDAQGGIPTGFEQEGNGQSARIGKTLPQPLRLKVFNEFGQIISFPQVEWVVTGGQAQLVPGSDSDGATAVVTMGSEPGSILIEARIGNLSPSFIATATPPQPTMLTALMGTGQALQVGALSAPLLVEARESNSEPSIGAFIDFSSPPNVEMVSTEEGGPTGNPLRLTADVLGRASVRVRLLGIPIGLSEAGAPVLELKSVTVVASAGQNLSALFPIDILGRDPFFEAGGVVNAATFVPGIVPGSIASIFGVGLSEGVEGTVLAGGETTFAGTTVTFAGIPAPLLTITNQEGREQINLQVPFEVVAGQAAIVRITNNDTALQVAGVPVFGSQPGVFAVPDGSGGTTGAVLDAQTFQLITPGNAANKGQILALFFTGGGPLDPSVSTGEFGPAEPPRTELPVSVLVDGKTAEVSFGGYAPGFLGLYQANFAVPADAECGNRSLVVRIGGAPSPPSSIHLVCP